jgi:ATP-dependent Clp protease ATP-binding subunit ClpA
VKRKLKEFLKFYPEEKRTTLLIGEPGVGKSAIAEGLALRIQQKKYQEFFSEKE